jgi:MSHA biogenesis protein MshJ
MKAATPLHLAPLRAAWERQARRIDALSLRERAFLFLSIAAVLVLLFDTLVLTPLSARQKMRNDAQAQQSAEVAQLREQYVAASRLADDPSGRLRNELEAARAQRVRLDHALGEAGSAGARDGLAVVLQRLLAQQPGLVLETLTLLDEAAPAHPALPVLPGIGWQGVELRVQGGYRELQRYVQALERELPGLRWGELRLQAGAGNEPARLQVQLFMLKVLP